jgi:hypothetical protein
VDLVGGQVKGQAVLDGEEVDFAGDEKFEKTAVERWVVTFSLAGSGFALDPFVPAVRGY